MKAALGQRINVEGLTSSLGIFAKNKHLVIPHIAVPDIRYIDWAELKRRGFEGVVFDKDNTLTFPYSLRLWSPLRSSIEQCKALFGNNIAVFSNSSGDYLSHLWVFTISSVISFELIICMLCDCEFVGLFEYDPDGRNAKILERAIGIKVIRHSEFLYLYLSKFIGFSYKLDCITKIQPFWTIRIVLALNLNILLCQI